MGNSETPEATAGGAGLMLKKTDARCAGIYSFEESDVCPVRQRCLRYLHFARLDREAGLKHYRDIPVLMASRGCDIFMDAGEGIMEKKEDAVNRHGSGSDAGNLPRKFKATIVLTQEYMGDPRFYGVRSKAVEDMIREDLEALNNDLIRFKGDGRGLWFVESADIREVK